ncbi:MAG: helix-turn-helix domain-containing protein [Chitinispirillaceae bacterium]
MGAGSKFRRMRQMFDLSQTQMGQILGVSYVTISKWERVEPGMNSQQMKQIISIGLNPLYLYTDKAEVLMPGIKESQVRKNLKKKLKEGSNS